MSGKTAYFFGTFNPIHNGHLIVAQSALSQFGLDGVCFIPAGCPPHRQGDPSVIDVSHRLAMVRLACEGNPYFKVSDIEARRSGPSYTVESLRELEPGFESGDSHPMLILGHDALSGLGSWREADVLVSHCHFLQAPRLACPPVTQVDIGGAIQALQTTLIDMACVDISATLVRSRCQSGSGSLVGLVPNAVMAYIESHHLYQSRVLHTDA